MSAVSPCYHRHSEEKEKRRKETSESERFMIIFYACRETSRLTTTKDNKGILVLYVVFGLEISARSKEELHGRGVAREGCASEGGVSVLKWCEGVGGHQTNRERKRERFEA